MVVRKSASVSRQSISFDPGRTESSASLVSPRSSSTAIPMLGNDPSGQEVPTRSPPPDWYSDRFSIFLLIMLYTAQGIPMGLAFGSIPFLLKERGSTYAELATFSLASLPYSLKLFIAPIVDSFYYRSFGRRKSWIVPIQLIIGLTMFLMGATINLWVVHGNVHKLTPMFILLLAMTATQDIAVDGWSLTMLRKSNVSYASTCQSLGLSIGYFSTFTVFLAFSNDQFCDKYVRPFLLHSSAEGALVSLQSALRIAGLYYLFLTLYITFFKKETSDEDVNKKSDDNMLETESSEAEIAEHTVKTGNLLTPGGSAALESIQATYTDLLLVVRKPAVRSLVLALLIAKVGFSSYDNGLLFRFSCYLVSARKPFSSAFF